MGSMVRSYSKINAADQARLEARRKTFKRTLIIALSSFALVGIIVAAVVGTTVHNDKSGGGSNEPQSMSTSVKAACDVTLYKDTCMSSLTPMVGSTGEIKPEDIFRISIQVALQELAKVVSYFSGGDGGLVAASDGMSASVVGNCRDLLGLALDHLNMSLASASGVSSLVDAVVDLRSWLSTAVTCQHTCIDGFLESAELVQMHDGVQNRLQSSTELTSNSLAIVTWLSNILSTFKLRKLLSHRGDEMPEWVSPGDRKLLQSTDLRSQANAVVAKDGSGKYKTIGAALAAVPSNSNKRFVIYVKKGVYNEHVVVDKTKWNVVMVGDGMDVSIVTGNLNVVDGTPTFSSATFSVFGQGFIARDMGFVNTAGAIKQQAVALQSSADLSIFYRCRIDAFQDTLYVHTNRQFYRDCNISGTVDFIFGNSAVVLQNCNIHPKKPILGQQNTLTAQGKIDPNQNTGIVIHNCTIWPGANLTSVQTYLGRPWKNYSTTVYTKTYMPGIIAPQGWLPWVGTTAPNTIFYAEFQNYGAGASTKGRVNWKGLKFISASQASKFSVSSFIQGGKWIDKTIPYNPNL
ncbi:hypothetical protein MLD38_002490 [Melastoma candidum]|uniref:Uncharacterized protein n=1 Tax=Melastoma candidum TaxID=119954 RepID=A0ACB9S389_9MYRT|nr:hypothetical protein MLD38_002490 [Melastoma candidum]